MRPRSFSGMRRLRIFLATLSIIAVTLLFLDFTGTLHHWLGWLVKIQFLPAFLALNVVVVAGLIAATLLLGRVYCSVVCPLGIMQDIVSRLNRRKNRFRFRREKKWLRYGMLVLFFVLMVAGFSAIASLIAPYSSYGRIVTALLQPLYMWCNNLLAYFAERVDSYAFYTVDVWVRNWVVVGVAAVTLAVVSVLAWRGGRTWCNTVCPVGTVLGFFARFSLFKPVIDTDKCVNCGLCARNCKASCIDVRNHKIDYSRCVTCFDCIDKCHSGAIAYTPGHRRSAAGVATGDEAAVTTDSRRRSFLSSAGMIVVAGTVGAQIKTVDGGLAAITDKVAPKRATRIVPPGAVSLRHFEQHCTSCQLCVSECPNGVLRPSSDFEHFMQPQSSYERGYCRPECTRCSDVCPSGAIRPLTVADKSSVQIGHAVWVAENCVPLTDGVNCGNCARHCPAGAIQMVPAENASRPGLKIPAVNTERCIGCGACENLCPARPFSAIYVEGHEEHRTI